MKPVVDEFNGSLHYFFSLNYLLHLLTTNNHSKLPFFQKNLMGKRNYSYPTVDELQLSFIKDLKIHNCLTDTLFLHKEKKNKTILDCNNFNQIEQ